VLWGPVSDANPAGIYSYQVVADASADAYVLASLGDGTLTITKYSGEDGSMLWSLPYTVPDAYLNSRREIVDGAGHLDVVADVADDSGHHRTLTLRVDGPSSAVLWAKLFEAAPDIDSFPTVVAAALSGDVFVVGGTISSGVFGWFVVKYSASV